MKKYVVLILVCLISVFPMSAEAATGTIEVQLKAISEGTMQYIKVANMVNGVWELEEAYKESKVDLNTLETAMQLESAAKTLMRYAGEMQSVPLNDKTNILLQDLEAGLYLFTFTENEKHEISPSLVALPGWDGEEMRYHVQVLPKQKDISKAPLTGQNSAEQIYKAMIFISFIIIAGLYCQNHFKCGKITVNYSDIGGYTDGNDNDTKDPCSSRRIRQRSCRSVDRSKVRRSDGK